MRIMNSKLVRFACNCMITCYLLFMIGDFNIWKRCSFSAPSWLERKDSSAGLEKMSTFSQTIFVQNDYFVVSRLSKAVLRLFFLKLFEKCVMGYPSHCHSVKEDFLDVIMLFRRRNNIFSAERWHIPSEQYSYDLATFSFCE